jgi:hypothetical protein
MERVIEEEKFSPPHCAELLQRFEEKEALPIGEKLQFSGVGENDVYNISAPFKIGDATVIAGRVEAREAWADSHVMFFENRNDVWVPVRDAPTLRLEDGFATRVGDETIFGGVHAYPNPTEADPGEIDFETTFYRGRDFSSLQKFATGPKGMKDLRLDDQLDVFTRLQGGIGGRGKIGYVKLRRLEDLDNAPIILGARLIENQCSPEEWLGANELHPLQDGRVGVIGHIAYQDERGRKHYYAMSFEYDPKTHLATPLEILATRKNFPGGPAKTRGVKDELADVIFPGGLVPHGDGTGTLYAGLSDAEAGCALVLDPFHGKRSTGISHLFSDSS